MRFLALLVAVITPMTVASSALADHSTSPVAHTANTDWAYVAKVEWSTPLSTFLDTRRHHPAWADVFDWTTDGCSTPGHVEKGRFFDFHDACVRHDFGYRNLHQLERRFGGNHQYWNEPNRARVDQQFLTDMRGSCAHRSWLVRPVCRTWARVFYLGVRAFGQSFVVTNPLP